MKGNEAYSLEYNEIIDAEETYELYSEGLITDKKAFICTGNDCEAQITCTNIDREKEYSLAEAGKPGNRRFSSI